MFKTHHLDVNKNEIGIISDSIVRSDGIIVGSPTINRDAVFPIWQVLMHIDAISTKTKFATAFGSFGWSGEAVPMIMERLKSLKFKIYGEGFKAILVPSEKDLSDAFEYGAEFGKLIS